MLHKLYNEEFNEVQPERKHGVFGELEKSSYLLVHVMVWKQYWTNQYTKLFFFVEAEEGLIPQLGD